MPFEFLLSFYYFAELFSDPKLEEIKYTNELKIVTWLIG